MHRLTVELVGMLALSGVFAAAVFIVGAGQMLVPSPPELSRLPSGLGCRVEPLVPLGRSGVQGSAQLCVATAGVDATVQADNLAVGWTYTLWFSYLDQERPRAEESLHHVLGERPSGVAGRLDDDLASSTRASFSGEIRDVRPSRRSEVTLWLFERQPVAPGEQRSALGQLLPLGPTDLPVPPAGSVEASDVGSARAYARFQVPADDGSPTRPR